MKRIKKLKKKIEKIKEESTEEKMLLFFKLEEALEEEYTWGGNKNDKILAQQLYTSFERTYL